MEQFSTTEKAAMYASMFVVFNQIFPISVALQQEIMEQTEVVLFKKKSIILGHQKICRHCYFALKGFVRAYYVAENGEQVTSWFMKEGDVIISVRSFFRQVPSHEEIEVIEDAVCISLHYDLLKKIYAEFHEFNFVGRILTEEYYIQMEDRAFSLRMDNAMQRYEKLLDKHPDIVSRAQQNHIASYLGISAATLSRIRAKKSRN